MSSNVIFNGSAPRRRRAKIQRTDVGYFLVVRLFSTGTRVGYISRNDVILIFLLSSFRERSNPRSFGCYYTCSTVISRYRYSLGWQQCEKPYGRCRSRQAQGQQGHSSRVSLQTVTVCVTIMRVTVANRVRLRGVVPVVRGFVEKNQHHDAIQLSAIPFNNVTKKILHRHHQTASHVYGTAASSLQRRQHQQHSKKCFSLFIPPPCMVTASGSASPVSLQLSGYNGNRRVVHNDAQQPTPTRTTTAARASRSNSSSTATTTNDSDGNCQQEQQEQQQRPMSVRERVVKFSGSVQMLWKDWMLYQNIRDASATRRNAWSSNGKTAVLARQRIRQHYGTDDDSDASRIPWRQREQQRRFVDALSTVFPVVALWMVPVVGSIPMIVSIAAPRQLLSRHFHNDYEVRHYNRLAYQQRRAEFGRVVQEVVLLSARPNSTGKARFASVSSSDIAAAKNDRDLSTTINDAAGPLPTSLPQLVTLYRLAFGDDAVRIDTTTSPPSITLFTAASADQFPRIYLVHFALAVGIYQTFPPQISTRLAFWSPSWWLRRLVRNLAVAVTEDDSALQLMLLQGDYRLDEPAASMRCEDYRCVVATLTDLEVMDACLMRGLPVADDDVTIQDMRECLINHLNMIASFKSEMIGSNQSLAQQQPPQERNEMSSNRCSSKEGTLSMNGEAFGLFTLHLAIIRDHLKNR